MPLVEIVFELIVLLELVARRMPMLLLPEPEVDILFDVMLELELEERRMPASPPVPLVKIVLLTTVESDVFCIYMPYPAFPLLFVSCIRQLRIVIFSRAELLGPVTFIPNLLFRPPVPYVMVYPAQSSATLLTFIVKQVPLLLTLLVRVALEVSNPQSTGVSSLE